MVGSYRCKCREIPREFLSEGATHRVVFAGVEVLHGTTLVAQTGGLLMLKFIVTANGWCANGSEVCV